MQTEDQIREQLKQYGVELIINPGPLYNIMDDTIHVECDLDINLNLDWVNNCVLTKITKRNTKMFCTFEQKPETLTIRFAAILPKKFKETYKVVYGKQIATTFPDLCWLYAEGTTPTSVMEVETKQRENSELGDLLWLLPSRFTDDLIEMIHTINPEFMSGLMRDAIVYGPYYN
jgi:hypothetical protein